MEETLKHVRLLHYVLMGASVAAIVLTFAKYSDVTDRYDQAVQQVQTVRGLVGQDWKEGTGTVRDEFEPLIVPGIEKTRKEINTRVVGFISSHLTDIVRKKRPNAYPNDVELHWVIPFMYQSNLPITTTLKQIVTYFDDIPILAAIPDIDDLSVKNRILASPPSQTARIEINVAAKVDFDDYVKQLGGWTSATQSVPAVVSVHAFPKSSGPPSEEKSDTSVRVTRVPQFSQQMCCFGLILSFTRYYRESKT
jgi:hypothetical protein